MTLSNIILIMALTLLVFEFIDFPNIKPKGENNK